MEKINAENYIDLIKEKFPGFISYWDDYVDYWGLDQEFINRIDPFLDYVVDQIKIGNEIELKKIFDFVEFLLCEGDSRVQETIATSFLEFLMDLNSDKAQFSSCIKYLGKECLEYCKAWDERTGIRTKGLWSDAEITEHAKLPLRKQVSYLKVEGTKNIACEACGKIPEDPPWNDNNRLPVFENCVCCGLQLGYNSYDPLYIRKFREKWLKEGAHWFVIEDKPPNWSLEEQLKQIPEKYQFKEDSKTYSNTEDLKNKFEGTKSKLHEEKALFLKADKKLLKKVIPAIKDTADAIEDDWLMCPFCIDAWQTKSQDPMARCPKCEQILHNPRFKTK